MVGLGEVLQHTPQTVTGDSPAYEIFPPLFAEVPVITEGAIVVNKGAACGMVIILS
jgi:hypothetical protein